MGFIPHSSSDRRSILHVQLWLHIIGFRQRFSIIQFGRRTSKPSINHGDIGNTHTNTGLRTGRLSHRSTRTNPQYDPIRSPLAISSTLPNYLYHHNSTLNPRPLDPLRHHLLDNDVLAPRTRSSNTMAMQRVTTIITQQSSLAQLFSNASRNQRFQDRNGCE